ncbi:MAG: HD domain-containing protein [Prolixibacteraceae bacterium]
METQNILDRTVDFIAAEFGKEGSGHDWFHVDRVRKMAVRLGEQEGGDLFVIELAALLHDLDDWKLNGPKNSAVSRSSKWLAKMEVSEDYSSKILRIIDEVSYKGAGTDTPVSSLESAVVQDADRLDAIGAIGIARTFAYGGNKNRLIYDPSVPPVIHEDFEVYKKSTDPTINHFYEKLLLLKERLNTRSAKEIAKVRHRFMEDYLQQFFDEWEAKR